MKKQSVLTGAQAADLLMTWFREVLPNERMQRLMNRFPSPADWDTFLAQHPQPLDPALRALAALPVDDQAAAIAAWSDDLLAAFASRIGGAHHRWTSLEARLPVFGIPDNALTVDELMSFVIQAGLLSPSNGPGNQ